LKWAQTQDGFIAPLILRQAQDDIKNRKPVWITNTFSRQLVHKWRSEEQAILVGTNTVIDDNPKLNVRDWTGKNPIRIILDQNNRIPKASHIYDNQAKTIIFSNTSIVINEENSIFEILNLKKNSAKQILDALHKHQIQSVIIEGGLRTLQTFIDENLWDEARIFIGNQSFETGIKAPILELKKSEKHTIGNDLLIISRNND
jgi:diaminohydroxyphosphoribosylaminopyrimidine deaminase/5-amino-6-(5-phosphoribosylamino)uracil reductase